MPKDNTKYNSKKLLELIGSNVMAKKLRVLSLGLSACLPQNESEATLNTLLISLAALSPAQQLQVLTSTAPFHTTLLYELVKQKVYKVTDALGKTTAYTVIDEILSILDKQILLPVLSLRKSPDHSGVSTDLPILFYLYNAPSFIDLFLKKLSDPEKCALLLNSDDNGNTFLHQLIKPTGQVFKIRAEQQSRIPTMTILAYCFDRVDSDNYGQLLLTQNDKDETVFDYLMASRSDAQGYCLNKLLWYFTKDDWSDGKKIIGQFDEFGRIIAKAKADNDLSRLNDPVARCHWYIKNYMNEAMWGFSSRHHIEEALDLSLRLEEEITTRYENAIDDEGDDLKSMKKVKRWLSRELEKLYENESTNRTGSYVASLLAALVPLEQAIVEQTKSHIKNAIASPAQSGSKP